MPWQPCRSETFAASLAAPMNGQPMTCRGCRAALARYLAAIAGDRLGRFPVFVLAAKQPDLLGRAVWVQNIFDDDDGDSIYSRLPLFCPFLGN